MIEVDRHLIGLWFVPLPGHQGHDNWLGALSRRPGGRLRLVQRLRCCDPLEPGADPFEGLDEKEEQVGTFDGSPEEAVRHVRQAAQGLAAQAGTTVHELMMNPERDVRRFAQDLMAQPWVQARRVA